MIKKFLAELIKKYKKIKNRKFYKKLNEERSKIYLNNNDSSNNFNSRKNKYKIFTLSRKYIKFIQINNNKYTVYYYYIAIFLFLLSIYILFFSSYFSIQKIYIDRNDELTNINIAYKSVENLYGNSIILLDELKVINSIKSYQKNIKKVEFRKMFPDSIKITLTSYKGAFNTKLFDKEYILTNNGILIPIKNDPKLKFLNIHFKDKDNLGIVDYKEILNADDIVKASNIINKLPNLVFDIKIKDIDYFPTEKEIHINSNQDTKLIYDLTGNLTEQLVKTQSFFEKYKDIIKEGITYVDLRIQGKIFYCPNSVKNQCQKNLKKIYRY